MTHSACRWCSSCGETEADGSAIVAGVFERTSGEMRLETMVSARRL